MTEYGYASSAGLWLTRGLGEPADEDCGRYVAWAPDGRLLAVPNGPSHVRILDVESAESAVEVATFRNAGGGFVNRVSWSPDGSRIAGACGFDEVRVWRLDSLNRLDRPNRPLRLKQHGRWVGQVAWSHSADLFASGGQDGNAVVWDIRSRGPLHILRTGGGYVNCLAWSPDDRRLATGSADGVVVVWNTDVLSDGAREWKDWDQSDIVTCLAWSPDGELLVAGTSGGQVTCLPIHESSPDTGLVHLEGHTDSVSDVGFSADGTLLGTASADGTIRLWRTDDWTTVAVLTLPEDTARSPIAALDLPDPHDGGSLVRPGDAVLRTSIGVQTDNPQREDDHWRSAPAFAFHPTLPRIAVQSRRTGVALWDYDADVLLGRPAPVESVRYMTAKVVLVGDSGVGKTGLGWRLAHDEFREHASTHGQQFWAVDAMRTRRVDGTDCEAVLWDLAGQHIYRPVHAIFLDNVDVALVLFDPTNRQEPLKGVRFWLQQLSGGRQLPPAVLVGARVDRGDSACSRAELEQFCQQQGISGGYVSTSAATGDGVGGLMELLRKQIPWERMTTTVTTVTFKRIKEFVLTLKERSERGEVLVLPADLRRRLEATDPDWEFTDAEMMTAVGHLENHGYVCVLRTSSGARAILLAPELLVDLASSIFLQADKHPQELGAVSEAALLAGEHRFPEVEALSPDERQVLLDAAVVRFLEHNLCFRETLGAEILLIFPGLIKYKRPLFDTVETVDDMTYVVRGRVENVYPALVVLLGHTRRFVRVNQWQNQAQFEMGRGEICGLRLLQEREGEIELVLHYSEAVPPYGRRAFQGLLEGFLYERHGVTVSPFPPVACGNGHKQDRTVVIGSLREELRTMFCSRCGERIALPEIEGPVALGAEDNRIVGKERAVARVRSAYETRLVRVKSFRADRAAPRCYVSHLPEDADWVALLTRDLRKAGVLVVEDVEDVREDDVVLAVVTSEYGRTLAGPEGPLTVDAGLLRARRSPPGGPWPRVVPLMRGVFAEDACPAVLRGLVPGDFRDDLAYVVNLFDLVLTLYAIPFSHPAFEGLRGGLRMALVDTTAERLLRLSAEESADVYLSYSWSEDSDALADELDRAFQERGITMVRDRRDAGYKASIGDFMRRIGQGKCVILVISDAYLKSPNCLCELLQVAARGEFRDRVFPVVLPDALIHEPVDRIRYVRYWEQRTSELDEALKTVSSANLDGFREDMDLYTEIRARLPRLADILRDMNTLTVDLHRDSAYTEVFDAVMARLDP
ncbi:MAG: TIR domain-containing protein [Streptomyces sp.]|nr:TIR domain-containing protein [Streptomyces sp.]NUR64186.1 TIR domain-containing protein [Streptomyces sp.]NUS25474.1 TIR domain-containing protein [Streptomyces sp.]NUS80005.1 TIR domain-containing protein [Streptomyces sp.]